jgi:AcrR family transcriptional regulator
MIPQTRREKLREATSAEIKKVALEQMTSQGAATLSLRAIATQMGMSAPALYNYYKSRDDLITALIIDAYNSLAAELEKISYALPSEQYGARFVAVMLGFRQWAIDHREQFILIYGTPIPGYHAPEEQTTPASIRASWQFVAILKGAWEAQQIKIPPEYQDLDTPMHRQAEAVYEARGWPFPMKLLHIAMAGWSFIHGAVSLELYGHLDYLGGDLGEFFREEVIAYAKRLNLDPHN